MDFWFVAVSALLIFTVDSVKSENNNSTTSNSTISTTVPTTRPCPTLKPMSELGFFVVEWGPNCTGSVVLKLGTRANKAVCFKSISRVFHLFNGVCEQKKGCKGMEKETIGKKANGVEISGNEVNETNCDILNITCEVERPLPPVQEPVGFRVATALLSMTLVLLLLIFFGKPTVRALQKRLSNKRKNRWIGPTQSHSVSYQRGQVNKNLDGQKHSSYPALDRLVVGNPPSNRNSYNF